jgi:hypothetical protein
MNSYMKSYGKYCVTGIIVGMILTLIATGVTTISLQLNCDCEKVLKLQNEALKLNYATLVVGTNGEAQFQWIEPETKESIK